MRSKTPLALLRSSSLALAFLALLLSRAHAQNEPEEAATAAVAPKAAGPGARGGGGFGMGPPATAQIVAAAAAAKTPVAPGPVQPTWDSLKAAYQPPQWLVDGKFGIFIHWGLYSVGAHHNEWYEKHMYGRPGSGDPQWHIEHFGPLDKFGYKDFIPLFTAAKFNGEDWAELFKKSGATIVVPTAEHHDWFALYNSKLNRWNSVNMGPHRDLIGELGTAVRKAGMHFGVSNHSIEHYTFINPPAGVKTDLDDPATQDFYWTEHNDARLQQFLELWVARNMELIDEYHPDVLWFDNGVNARAYDPLKLKVGAYYYNRAKEWGKQVMLSTKSDAYLTGSIRDHERRMRAPTELTDYFWWTHDSIGSTWGYTEGMRVGPPEGVVRTLVDVVSLNGAFLLNISPTGDGTIPDDQRRVMLAIGQWLQVNGEGIYGSRPWTKPGEGTLLPPRGTPYTGKDFRFTTKGDTLYAWAMAWPGDQAVITSLATGAAVQGDVQKVELVGQPGALAFTRDADGLKVKLPAEKPDNYAHALKITGLKLRP
jgi:alpha-L-fucosidase